MPDPTDRPPTDLPADDPDDVVRRRLAAARVDTPAPPDVVARLDRVLADLRAEAVAATGTPDTPSETGTADTDDTHITVARLQDRRRRWSWVTRGLAAACAVVTVGGVAYLAPRADLSGGGASDSSADSGGAAVQGESEAARPAAGPVPFIRPARAAADIAQRVPGRLRAPLDAVDASLTVCVPRRDGGSGVAVSYGGRRAALVFGPAVDGVQEVTVYACDGVHGGTRLRVVRVPAP